MKWADELVAKVNEKSTHHQVNANAGEDDNHQQFGEYRSEDFIKPFDWHV
jgi:hypothetical protein